VDLSEGGQVELHDAPMVDWKVTCVDTGLEAMTGARLKRVQRYIHTDTFLLTYGDGLSDVPVPETVAFHREHGKIATVTGVRPQNRFGELVVEGGDVTRFSEKPAVEHSYINGGFFVFDRRVFDYVTHSDACVLEREPLERLAEDRQLAMFPHHGYWQCMDTYRDLLRLEADWNDGDPPWKSW
jgi:glucose-1-phosphate cytidylyltransferase